MSTETEFTTPTMLAKRLSLSEKTIYRQIAAGKLSAVKIGNAVRIPEASIESWLEEAAV